MNYNSASKALKIIDRYALKFWPIHRKLLRTKLFTRCNKCILSEKFVEIGTDGICAECEKDFKSTRYLSNDSKEMTHKFDGFMNKLSFKEVSSYHGVILFSGGKDSVYMTSRLLKEYPDLKLAALLVDHGFLNPTAISNANSVAKKLGIDLFTFRPAGYVFKNAIKYAFENLRGGTCTKRVDELEGRLIYDIGMNFAANMKIPAVIRGASYGQILKNDVLRSFVCSDTDPCFQKREIVSGYSLKEIYGPNLKEVYQWWWDPNRFGKSDIPKVVSPFYAWRLHEEEIRESVTKQELIECGNDSPLSTNTPLILLEGIIDYRKYGYSGFEEEFARMIRQGKANRSYWLNIFQILELGSQTEIFLKPLKSIVKDLDLNL